MQENIFKQLIQIVDKKFQLNQTVWEKMFPWENIEKWLKWGTYLDSIIEEVEEAKVEIKPHNSVYLEDELWDILWDYINMLHCFEKEWYINQEKVFERCLKKYKKRIDSMQKWVSWDEIKISQKQELTTEHNIKYNSKNS